MTKRHNTLALFWMMAAMGVSYPEKREQSHVTMPDLSTDDIERIKQRIAAERKAKRAKRRQQ